MTIKKTEPIALQVPNSDWQFKGVYSKRVFAEGDAELGKAYGFVAKKVEINGNDFDAGQFVKAGKNAWLRPMRAYLVYEPAERNATLMKAGGLNNSLEAVSLPEEIVVQIVGKDGSVKEMGRLNTVTGEFRTERWFDMKGRKLGTEPSAQGTYFHYGKQVIAR